MITTIKVELFAAPGCTRCARARRRLQGMVEAIHDERLEWRTVEVLDEIDYAVAVGVLATPAIAINGELVFTSLPSKKQLQAELDRRLSDPPDSDDAVPNLIRQQR